MRCLLLIFLALLPAAAQLPDFKAKPSIFIVLDAKQPGSFLINGDTFTKDEARQWLTGYSAKFGRKDPIFVIADREVSLGLSADAVQMARATHDEVYGVIKAYSLDDPLLFFDTNHIANPQQLLAYLIQVQRNLPRLISPSSDSKALYISPPRELIERLATPAAK